jgi:hypothetical protein
MKLHEISLFDEAERWLLVHYRRQYKIHTSVFFYMSRMAVAIDLWFQHSKEQCGRSIQMPKLLGLLMSIECLKTQIGIGLSRSKTFHSILICNMAIS